MAECSTDTAASNSTLTATAADSINLEKWTCDALKAYLKSNGLTYSGLRKAELVAKSF